MRRAHLPGRKNILQRLLIHGAAFNLSLILRKVLGAGTPRGFREFAQAFLTAANSLAGSLYPPPWRFRQDLDNSLCKAA
jgi:hypothetical protein